MEELQDAIEDAQYVNAISSQDHGPQPVLAWPTPSDEELEQWKSTHKPSDSLPDILNSAIGLFLFSSFLKDQCNDYLRINFAEEVYRWKRLRGNTRVARAEELVEVYLSPPKKNEEGNLLRPKKREIDELDLQRPIVKLEGESLEALCEANIDETNTKSCIGLCGRVVDEIKSIMKEAELVRSQKKLDTAAPRTQKENGENEAKTADDENETKTADETKSTDEVKTEGPKAETETKTEEKPREASKSEDLLKKQVSMLNIDRLQSRARKYLPDSLFDKAEAIVMETLRKQYWSFFKESQHYRKVEAFHWYRDRRVVPEDFFVLRVLGRGGFGLVTACKKGTSGKLYAMKVMNKRRIKMKKSEQLALNERASLAAVESPFVVNLKYSFHSKDDVFLILDLMTGGDLGFHLHQKGRFPKKECLYYAARIMLGLQALHDHRFVYRDLKPENCLLADDGRVKITDLGLATKITPTLHGAAGTRGYWAPEMLRRDSKGKRMPYGHTVDWFSFGCCLAEFISGSNPFRSEAALNFGISKGKPAKEKAIDCATLEMDPEFDSKYFDADAADLCRRLLDKDETTRLGTNGCEEIMVHPYFKDVTWELILSDRKKPPFLPAKDVNAASQSEIGNFAEDKSYQETVIKDKDEEVYKDWDWTNPHAFAAEVIEFLIYERETGEPLVPMSQQSTCCCLIM